MRGDMSHPQARIVSVAEAAAALGVSVRTIQRRIATGELATDRDSSGRVRVRLDPLRADPPPTDSAATLIVRDTLTHLLDRYRGSLDRMERTRTRVLALGVAGATLGVAGVVGVVAMSATSRDLGGQVADARAETSAANAALVQSLRELGDLRAELATATELADNLTRQARHADAMASQAVAACERMEAERDALADDLADLRTEFVLGPFASATP